MRCTLYLHAVESNMPRVSLTTKNLAVVKEQRLQNSQSTLYYNERYSVLLCVTSNACNDATKANDI